MRIIILFILICAYLNGAESNKKSGVQFEHIPQNIIRMNIISLLDLSTINSLVRTSKKCSEYSELEELCYSSFNKNYFQSVRYDYIECTKLLGYIGGLLENYSVLSQKIKRKTGQLVYTTINKKKADYIKKKKKNKCTNLNNLFEFLWHYDNYIRKQDSVALNVYLHKPFNELNNLECVLFTDQMKFYHQFYNKKCFDKTMKQDIYYTIEKKLSEKIHCLLLSKNVSLFEQLVYRSEELYFFNPKNIQEYTLLDLFLRKFIITKEYIHCLLVKLFKQSNDKTLCKLLTDKIINHTITDENDCNLLHYAAFYGCERVAKEVMSLKEISFYCKNNWGKLPLDYAILQNNRNIMRSLYNRHDLLFIEEQFMRYSKGLFLIEEEENWFLYGKKESIELV